MGKSNSTSSAGSRPASSSSDNNFMSSPPAHQYTLGQEDPPVRRRARAEIDRNRWRQKKQRRDGGSAPAQRDLYYCRPGLSSSPPRRTAVSPGLRLLMVAASM